MYILLIYCNFFQYKKVITQTANNISRLYFSSIGSQHSKTSITRAINQMEDGDYMYSVIYHNGMQVRINTNVSSQLLSSFTILATNIALLTLSAQCIMYYIIWYLSAAAYFVETMLLSLCNIKLY